MFIYCLTHSDQILYDNNYRGHGSREVKRPPPLSSGQGQCLNIRFQVIQS